MKKEKILVLKWFLLIIVLLPMGCSVAKYQMAETGTLPTSGLNWSIEESQHFQELMRNYGKGIYYERSKINYLLGHTASSPFTFDRNGYVYDGEATAAHLRNKYRRDIKKIKTARDYIDNVASISNGSGRAYYALPGDGFAYLTGNILHYELERLETYMDNLHGVN